MASSVRSARDAADGRLAPGDTPQRPREVVIASPASGRFHQCPVTTVTAEGEVVQRGQLVGVVSCCGQRIPVKSAFTGFLLDYVPSPNDRVELGEPIARILVL